MAIVPLRWQGSVDRAPNESGTAALPCEPLPPEGWLRAATVTGAGKVLERTVLSYAQWLASHERTHVKQIERVVNTLRLKQRLIP